MCVESAFSETLGSHNELIVVREIPFHHVMKLSMALASFSLPSCYLCVMGGSSRRQTHGSVCLVTVRLHFMKGLTYAPALRSFHRFRAVLRQRRGVGASHLLLLQRDRHGVQLPGEGTDPVHRLALLC